MRTATDVLNSVDWTRIHACGHPAQKIDARCPPPPCSECWNGPRTLRLGFITPAGSWWESGPAAMPWRTPGRDHVVLWLEAITVTASFETVYENDHGDEVAVDGAPRRFVVKLWRLVDGGDHVREERHPDHQR